MAESEDKKGKVEKYLKEHSGATEDQIAKDTGLHIIDVLAFLQHGSNRGSNKHTSLTIISLMTKFLLFLHSCHQ